jgi:hypothetical protein
LSDVRGGSLSYLMIPLKRLRELLFIIFSAMSVVGFVSALGEKLGLIPGGLCEFFCIVWES